MNCKSKSTQSVPFDHLLNERRLLCIREKEHTWSRKKKKMLVPKSRNGMDWLISHFALSSGSILLQQFLKINFTQRLATVPLLHAFAPRDSVFIVFIWTDERYSNDRVVFVLIPFSMFIRFIHQNSPKLASFLAARQEIICWCSGNQNDGRINYGAFV